MNIIVAPDTFKGSISAKDICVAVHKGISNVFSEAEVHLVPLADGGEGTLDSLMFASNGELITARVKGPLGHDIDAAYGVIKEEQTAVIELAQASGLTLIHPDVRNPLLATSYGTGELIRHALDSGYRKFVIGLGGSATNDAGTGILMALGLKIYDQTGELLPNGGGALLNAAYYDDSNLDSRLKESTFIIATDVTNKLCGPEGASAVFGPQKGAASQDVDLLDQALNQFAEVVYKQKGIDMRTMTGGGAAGGAGAGLMAFLDAEIKPGIDVIMDVMKLEQLMQDADLVITGEGRLDNQTLFGKVISGVCKAAQKYNVPVIALCGSLELEPKSLDQLGLLSAFSIVPGPCSLHESMEMAPKWIAERTEFILRMLKHKA